MSPLLASSICAFGSNLEHHSEREREREGERERGRETERVGEILFYPFYFVDSALPITPASARKLCFHVEEKIFSRIEIELFLAMQAKSSL